MYLLKHTTKGTGYVMNDDRCAGGQKTEAEIISCWHCQKILKLQDWKQDGGWCGKCNKHLCGPCSDKMLTKGCEPFMQRLETMLENNYRSRQLARMLGI